MRTGMLYGVSVGPGDRELMTLKAVRVIREADVVALPDAGDGRLTAASIAGDLLQGKEHLLCPTPMTRDSGAMRAAHERTADRICTLLDEGKTVAYLCLGDIALYSSFSYVCDAVQARGYATEVIPGVTSYSAAAASLRMPLCQGEERLLIAPVGDDLDEVLSFPATKVLMKPRGDTTSLNDLLAAHGLLSSTSAVTRCGFPDERVVTPGDDEDELGYLTVYIVRG